MASPADPVVASTACAKGKMRAAGDARSAQQPKEGVENRVYVLKPKNGEPLCSIPFRDADLEVNCWCAELFPQAVWPDVANPVLPDHRGYDQEGG
jgi:hypothetical protein